MFGGAGLGEGEREQRSERPKRDSRPIDRVRDGAGVLTVGTKTDGVLTGMIALSDVAFMVKERAIYKLLMADDIDPGRENINIPNSVQLVLDAGSNSDLIARTILTADILFPKTYFSDGVRGEIVLGTVEIAKNLLAAQEIVVALRALVDELSQPVEVKDRAATLPSVGSLEQRVNAFVQAAHSAVQQLYDLPRSLIKFPPRGWPDNFTEAVRSQWGDEYSFTHFARSMIPFVKLVRNARHCVEHRRGDQRIDARDFHLTKDGRLNRPTIAIVHSATPLDNTDLIEFMNWMLGQLVEMIEAMLAHLADASRPESLAGLPLAILEVPVDQRRAGSQVRYAYFTLINRSWVRLG
jgi:hypothetical protein